MKKLLSILSSSYPRIEGKVNLRMKAAASETDLQLARLSQEVEIKAVPEVLEEKLELPIHIEESRLSFVLHSAVGEILPTHQQKELPLRLRADLRSENIAFDSLSIQKAKLNVETTAAVKKAKTRLESPTRSGDLKLRVITAREFPASIFEVRISGRRVHLKNSVVLHIFHPVPASAQNMRFHKKRKELMYEFAKKRCLWDNTIEVIIVEKGEEVQILKRKKK